MHPLIKRKREEAAADKLAIQYAQHAVDWVERVGVPARLKCAHIARQMGDHALAQQLTMDAVNIVQEVTEAAALSPQDPAEVIKL